MKDIAKSWIQYILVVTLGFITGSFIGYVFDFGYIFGLGGGGQSNGMYCNKFYFLSLILIAGIIIRIILLKVPSLRKLNIKRAIITGSCSVVVYIIAYPICYIVLLFLLLLHPDFKIPF